MCCLSRALDILGKIKEAVNEGLQRKVIQSTPHTVLINKAFYHANIKVNPSLVY